MTMVAEYIFLFKGYLKTYKFAVVKCFWKETVRLLTK